MYEVTNTPNLFLKNQTRRSLELESISYSGGFIYKILSMNIGVLLLVFVIKI